MSSSPSPSRPRVFVTRRTFPEAAARLRAEADVQIWEQPQPATSGQLASMVKGAAGLYTHITEKADSALMDAAGGSLKVIAQFGVGYDNVDVAAATERGVCVGNTPGVLTETAADHAFALLIAAARRVAEGERFVRSGGWKWFDPLDFLGAEVNGATLGIIGLGRIGGAMARRAVGFNMKVIYFSRNRPKEEHGATRADSIDALLGESDFVSIHVPLNSESRHLINADRLAKMKPGAILINTARGGVVDQKALADALASGGLAHAALDVTDPEPPSPDDPLLKLANVTIVPHVASATSATRMRMAMMTVDNVLAGIRGEKPPYCVNPDALTRRRQAPR